MPINLQAYLEASEYIDCRHPAISAKALALANHCHSDEEISLRCFEFVRDEIKHSWDYQLNPVTCKASDVLLHGTGYCYAKAHLLAALLRVNSIPAGLCYQRLSLDEQGPPYCLHGLNAIYLKQYGWYRVDARGNKPGVNAAFNPPHEQLAFPVIDGYERDFPEIWPEPLPVVTKALTQFASVAEVYKHLPDIEVLPATIRQQMF